jgi:hypothetical protein
VNKFQKQRLMIENAFGRGEQKSPMGRKVAKIIEDSFARTGSLPAVNLVAKQSGASWQAVNALYPIVIDQLPGKHAVESAYAQFLKEACLHQREAPQERLLQLAATARLTANRVGSALQVDAAQVEIRAKQYGIELSRFEAPGLALPRRLTDEALHALGSAKVSIRTAARVAGVAILTLTEKMERLKIEVQKQETRRRRQIVAFATADELRQFQAWDEVIIAAARALLSSEERDPDELLPGAYEQVSDAETKLLCDEVRIEDNRAIGLIYAYRQEAVRIRHVLNAILHARDKLSHERTLAKAA